MLEVEKAFTEHVDLLNRRYGAEAAEQIYLRWHIAVFPNLHLMEFKFRVIQPVAMAWFICRSPSAVSHRRRP